MIRIDIKPLAPGVHEFEWDIDAEALDLDSEDFGALHLNVRLDFQPTQIFVTMQTKALAHLVCDRTLVKFDQEVVGDYHILFSGSDMFDEEGDKQHEEDIRFLASDEDELDLTEAVRDTVMLSLPQRRIAPGAEAEEIPLQFGQPDGDGYVDPRWEALKQLKQSENDTSIDEGA